MLFWRKKVPLTISKLLTARITQFTHLLETGESEEWCKCLWAMHPDDTNVKRGHCRLCDGARNNGQHHTIEAEGIPDHTFVGVRKRRVDTHPFCPVHTKEGLIFKYLEWSDAND